MRKTYSLFFSYNVIGLLLIVLVAAGCSWTPEKKVFTAYQSYESAVNAVIAAREAGVIPDEAWPHIQEADRVAWAALQAYEAAIRNGGDVDAALTALDAAIAQLLIESNITP